MAKTKKLLLIILVGLLTTSAGVISTSTNHEALKDSLNSSQDIKEKKVLIITQGSDKVGPAFADGVHIKQLLGHFKATSTLISSDEYKPGQINGYDYTFYAGFYPRNQVPDKLTKDIYSTNKEVIWINSGFAEFCAKYPVRKKFGFSVQRMDSTTGYNFVTLGSKYFTKGEPKLNLINISNSNLVDVKAYAGAPKKKGVPYIVKSRNLLYFADSPFAYANETDRYLLFADMLHDILHEDHQSTHNAIIRIEDVNPSDDPEKLRDVADFLGSRGIPFAVGVVPYYVNPPEGVRVSLSDRPDFVDAVKYMVKNGGTVIMHGSTHQYKGVTAADYEFWDGSINKPPKDMTEEGISQKIEAGIQEFMKNGIFPLVWETPHYAAGQLLYRTIPKYFSTCMEQKLAIENEDYSQYFPYVIHKDMFGQKIIPETCGYVPLDKDINVSRQAVKDILRGAKAELNVRDGYAAFFFHSFLDLSLLKDLVDGIQAEGFQFVDLSEGTNQVHTKDRVILSGSQQYSITLNDQYLIEAYYNRDGELISRTFSQTRLSGKITKFIRLEPGQIYKAEPTEIKEQKEPNFVENIIEKLKNFYNGFFKPKESWDNARVAILWNHHARGAAYNDQASMAAAWRAVNVKVDTIFVGQNIELSKYNLLMVPYCFVDSMAAKDYDKVTLFAAHGGNVITDTKTELAKELGIKFTGATFKVPGIMEKYYPEEGVTWRDPELCDKFEIKSDDEIFCKDVFTESPVALGRQFGQGRFIFFGSRFDATSNLGYSHFPFLMDYVRRFMHLRPMVKRDQVEAYFDPGFRTTVSIETLVGQWVQQGIRIIHIAGWHEYPKYTYDYKRMIDLCHANGILVYAWLEPPQVSLKFWMDHPEFREKNFEGKDVRVSWRYPIAISDEKCQNIVTEKFTKFLSDYEFDGVNLAELYFESDQGFADPYMYTPMHPTAQTEVRNRYGIDLKNIFNPSSPSFWKNNQNVRDNLTKYRIEKVGEFYNKLLPRFEALKSKRGNFQVIVTCMDAYGSPELRQDIAVDMDQMIGLKKKYDFTLQIEDPQSLWSTDPMRYVEIGNKYKSILGTDSDLMLDLNILNFRNKNDITPFPTLIQTGTECLHLVRAASLGSPRLTVYAESSVNPQDLVLLPYAIASRVTYSLIPDGYLFESPYSFQIKLPDAVTSINIDGQSLSHGRLNTFLVPAGSHRVTLNKGGENTFSTEEIKTQILSISGNLLNVSYGFKDINFTYDSNSRTLIAVNREPKKVKIDGKVFEFQSWKGNDCYSLLLPKGKHYVELEAGDPFSYGISLTSLWSSKTIALFGTFAVALLAAMYLSGKLIKRKYKLKSA